jgi:hypothetical protein
MLWKMLSSREMIDSEEEALSVQHLMTHMPKNPFCDVCSKAKMQAKGAYKASSKPEKSADELEEAPKQFGDLITADHIITQASEDQGIDGQKAAIVMHDAATEWLSVYPVQNKSADEAYRAFMDIAGGHPVRLITKVYTDNSPELIKAVRDIGLAHATSTPGRPQTNGVAERAVRTVLEGARAALEASGLPPSLWPYRTSTYRQAIRN